MLQKHKPAEFARLSKLASDVAKHLKLASVAAANSPQGDLECELGSFAHHLPDLLNKSRKLAAKAKGVLDDAKDAAKPTVEKSVESATGRKRKQNREDS